MKLNAGEGRYRIELRCYRVGAERLFTITNTGGGHIGAITLAETTGLQTISKQGHRDDVVSQSVAEILHAGLGEDIAVVCGIHIDHATRDEIEILVDHAQQCAHNYLEKNHE